MNDQGRAGAGLRGLALPIASVSTPARPHEVVVDLDAGAADAAADQGVAHSQRRLPRAGADPPRQPALSFKLWSIFQCILMSA